MSIKWLVRAVDIDGKSYDLITIPMDSLLTFALIFKSAQKNEGLPPLSWIPKTWVNEIYPQFMDPKGVILGFLMIEMFDGKEILRNTIYFKDNPEGRKLHIDNEDILNAAGILLEHEMLHQKYFKQNEMSADFHMGYFDTSEEPIDLETIKEKSFWPDLKIAKSRTPDDNSGAFEFHPYVEHSKSDPGGPKIISLAPGGRKTPRVESLPSCHDDWYSEPSIETEYRIYINGKPSAFTVSDISFMENIDNNIKNGEHRLSELQGFMEMDQSLYNVLHKFMVTRDFKIGAHPSHITLEDGNDAEYSLFWGQGEKETCYVSPLKETLTKADSNFDDVDF